MKIISIDTQIKYIKLKTPFITSLRKVKEIEFVRVKIVCDNNLLAFGEAPATKAITGEDIDTILDSIESSKFFLLGLGIKEALEVLHNLSIGSSAKASLDMAFVSLLAQKQNKALYKFFGAKKSQKIYTDVTISLNEKEKMIFDAKEALKNNMWILKVKLGEDINHAIEVTRTLSTELKFAKLLIDANQAWDLKQSLFYIESVKDLDIELIEQPVQAQNLEDLQKITSRSMINIMADESIFTLDDVKKVIDSNSADMINIKLMKCGGITKAIEILEYARDNNIKCMLGSMLEGPISINIALHLSLAYLDVIKYIDLDSPLLYKEPSDELDFIYDGYEIKLDLIT
ncbi:MAG: dipeptide epimerase [Sulfurimonas sp.]|nr:MAG: dipeptide epimerase [Sulfurimonas sp.]